MNRIYQGRVSKVEIPDGKDEHGKPKWKNSPPENPPSGTHRRHQ
jgi:hypothetical protein